MYSKHYNVHMYVCVLVNNNMHIIFDRGTVPQRVVNKKVVIVKDIKKFR